MSEYFDDIELNQNEIKEVVGEQLSSFPSGALKGRIIFHTGRLQTYTCVNGVNESADTTLELNWLASRLRFSANINAGVDTVLDSVPVVAFTTVKWVFEIQDSTDDEYKTGIITATHKPSVNPRYILNNLVGDKISHTWDILLNTGSMELHYKNDEAHTVFVRISRATT